MGKRLTTKIFIDRAREVHGDKYDYSKVEYVKNDKKVCIICSKHGEFWQIPRDHMLGRGCFQCSHSFKLTTERFIERAKQKHGAKYDYSKVNYVNSDTKVCIICLEHGAFWQTPHNHLMGQGCPKCSGKFLDRDYFVERAQAIHGNKYDYSKVRYVDNKTKVCIVCREHGEFWQTPNSHLRGKGCPVCKTMRLRDTTEVFIKKAKRVHGNKYDYSRVDYVTNLIQVDIVCPIHGVFHQTPNNHIAGCGCPKCSPQSLKSVETFIEEAQKIHGDKYDYSKVQYVGRHEDICIVCPKHGDFWQTPGHHLNGHGCPKCAHLDSSYEEYLNDKLISLYGKKDIEREYDSDNRYPFHCDFYIKSLDLFVEVNGFWTHNDHWFDKSDSEDVFQVKEWQNKNMDIYQSAIDVWTERDVDKREHARRNNLNYVVFWNKQDIDEWIAEGCPIRKDWK